MRVETASATDAAASMGEGTLRVSVSEASIAGLPVWVDGLVNAGNPHLGLGSGVSGAIARACGGLRFQKLVREALEDEFGEPLTDQDCLSTSAGDFPGARWVLHVAAVDYKFPDPRTGRASSAARVRACFGAVLEEVSYLRREHRLDSFDLATPLLGAGHGGLRVEESAEAIVGALERCSSTDSLTSLRFCCPEPAVAAATRGFLRARGWLG